MSFPSKQIQKCSACPAASLCRLLSEEEFCKKKWLFLMISKRGSSSWKTEWSPLSVIFQTNDENVSLRREEGAKPDEKFHVM